MIAVTTAFVALTCWWLSRDRSIPIYDAGVHLKQAITFHSWLEGGHLSKPFKFDSQYPPLAYLVGACAALVGGVNVASPIIGENLVFVSLLTLGCYQTGRLLFGARAGLLAAVFVLGAPVLIAQFHVFMLDAPETALVAVSMWLILASEDFKRGWIAAWAGLAVGCGLLLKETFPFFVTGIVAVALVRGGWRRWRGLTAFAGTVFVVAAPWYLYHLSDLRRAAPLASRAGTGQSNVNPTFAIGNLTYYFRSTVNWYLYAPLSILAFVGLVWTIVALRYNWIPRRRGVEFLVGGFVAWLAITLTPHHNLRYGMPLLPYLAVIGTGWITLVSRSVRIAAICVLVLAVAGNTLGTTFGVARPVITPLTRLPRYPQALSNRIMWYSNAGFIVAAPQRDGDVPGLLRALRRDGVRLVTFGNPPPGRPLETPVNARTKRQRGGTQDFSTAGLEALALIARVQTSPRTDLVRTHPRVAELIHGPIASSASPPCTKLSNGTGVWVLRLDTAAQRVSLYCPYRQPH